MPSPLALRIEVHFTLNGQPTTVRAYPLERLLDVLRQQLGQTGAKEGCGEGECGACSILVDGELVNACLVPVLQIEGADVVTVEGLDALPEYEALSRAFVELNATQCGICTPGMVVASVALLRASSSPTTEQIREALAGNLCRCTGYVKIIDAVAQAAAVMRADAAARTVAEVAQ